MNKPSTQEPKELQEFNISVYIAVARRLADEQKLDTAETIFKTALRMAEKISGSTGALSGTILVELFFLYQDAGRDSEATLVWQRIREILFPYHLRIDYHDKCIN